ncbi:MAG: hypothetical protein ACK4PR_01240 [Gammaproteobacteria bacterium]
MTRRKIFTTVLIAETNLFSPIRIDRKAFGLLCRLKHARITRPIWPLDERQNLADYLVERQDCHIIQGAKTYIML